MLLNGEAIVGLVDFTADFGSLSRMENLIAQRAAILGARCRCHYSGSILLATVSRARFAPTAPTQSESLGWCVTLAGNVVNSDSGNGACCELNSVNAEWIANGYEKRGIDFLGKLDGAFALALWQPRDQQLLLMTDPRGDAQLYYQVDGKRLIFSSWLQLIPGAKDEVDREAVKEFLRFLYISPPRTIFEGISRLEPGQYMSGCHGKVVIHNVNSSFDATVGPRVRVNDEDALNNFQELFEGAVRRRIGKRRVGVFLSSGIDSATLTAACQKVNPGQVEAFTVGFDDTELDETNAARALAQQIGVPHTGLKFDLTDYQRAFDCMVREFDQPFADPAGLAFILACDRVRDRVDVLTEGSGSDGLFGAPIPRHLWFSTAISAKLPRFLRKAISISLQRAPFPALSDQTALFDFNEVEELFITWPGWSAKELRELIGEPVCFAQTHFYRTFRAHQKAGPQEVYEAIGLLPPEDCRFEAAALANIPMTLPYHDAELRAFVRGLPRKFRISNGVTKILLRRVFKRIFPDGQLPTRKHYFNVPLQGLLARANFEIVREHLSLANLKRKGLVDGERAWRWIDRYINGDMRFMFKVWALLVLHAWAEERTKDTGTYGFFH